MGGRFLWIRDAGDGVFFPLIFFMEASAMGLFLFVFMKGRFSRRGEGGLIASVAIDFERDGMGA